MDKLINKLTEKIYQNISQRVLSKKNKLRMKRFQITDVNSVQLLSNVMHNKRINNRNPYLLNSKITFDIVTNLKFKSSYELIWGEGEELDSILSSIFRTGLKILQEQSDKNSKLIENCYLEYLPYAKATAGFEKAFPPFKPDIEDVAYAQSIADAHLYYGVSEDLKNAHKKYFEDKETKKLLQNISNFINNEITKLLHQYLKDSDNQGQRAYKIMSEIMSYQSDNEFDSISHGPEWYPHQPLTNSKRPLMEVRQEVIDAGNKYIDTIINEQKELDPFYMDYSCFM
ncbi:hypothetical protein IMAU80627_01164 [Lactobacillus helveticus]|uniref:hypothetical protein n=1 Tax=Lactobacillus helveticus TaxID=1587 RepID=UPI001562CBF5|nr:hypothetical protein [Lactobacillus helveticus]NRN72621.1 hypothetical protein [Lactobacillus helveticus]